MSGELDTLWALRAEDDRLRELESGLARIPAELRALEERAAADRRTREDQLQRIKQVQLERRALEKEAESLGDQEHKFQGQLPLVKTNQEYQALLQEIGAVKEKRSGVETRVLEGFEEEERLLRDRRALEAAAAESQRLADGRRGELESERLRLEAEAAGVRERRDGLLGRLGTGVRGRYERAHAALGGIAVVPVVRNACGGCMRQLPPQRVQEARRRESLVVCDGCGRMVIWPPDAT